VLFFHVDLVETSLLFEIYFVSSAYSLVSPLRCISVEMEYASIPK